MEMLFEVVVRSWELELASDVTLPAMQQDIHELTQLCACFTENAD